MPRCRSIRVVKAIYLRPKLASKITWDELTGIVSVEGVSTDNINYNCLIALVNSTLETIVSVEDSTSFLDASKDYREIETPLGNGFNALTIFQKTEGLGLLQ